MKLLSKMNKEHLKIKPKITKEHFKIIPNILKFRKLKISQQIFIAFLIAIVFSVFSLIVNVWNTNQILKANRQLVKAFSYRSIITDLKNISTKRTIQINSFRRLSENKIDLEVKDDFQIQFIATEIELNVPKIEMVLKDLAPEKLSEYHDLVKEVTDSCKTWEDQKGIATLFIISGVLQKFEFFVMDLTNILNKQIDAKVIAAAAQLKNIRLFNILFNLFISTILLIIIIPLLRDIRKMFTPVRQAADNAVQGATNVFDYTSQINESISELKNVLVEMTRSIGEVSIGAQDSSSQAEKIISSTQISSDLVAELGEIANTVYKNLDVNQSNLQEKITQVKQLSENVSQSLTMINQNADIAARLAVQVATLDKQMEGINSFLIAMAEITEQTNLLALNASIEAARAEEHGKGFAVVAERLRNLSDETKKFTTQIKHTVSGIQSVANEVAGALNNIITAVRNSAAEVSEVNQEFSNLKNVLQSLYGSNAAVLQAADLQLDGTKQIHSRSLDISKAMENITAQTEQVSASMEELAASSQEITAQIELIHTKVTETQQVTEHQLEMAKLTKETADHI